MKDHPLASVPPPLATADVYDLYEDALSSCTTQLQNYGAVEAFTGIIVTVRCHRDNALVKQTLGTDGTGKVLVVDGRGSLSSALMGDLIAQQAIDNGWVGVIIHGAIRDSQVISTLPLGVKALGVNPCKSAKTGAGEVNVPVKFGGVTFRPGDRIWSDSDGILVGDGELD